MRSKYISIAIVTAILTAPLLPSKVYSKSLKVGYFQVSPHAISIPDSKPAGVAVEYLYLIAEKMGVSKVRYILFPLNRLIIELERGRIDMALLLAKNQERAIKFVYPEHPFFFTQPSIAVHSSHILKEVDAVDSLLQFRILESAGAYRSPFIRDPRLQIKPLHGTNYTDRCYAMLLAGRIDVCYQPDQYPIIFEANRKEYLSRIRVIPLPEPPVKIFSVFSKQSAGTYLDAYELALAEVQEVISYEQMFHRFMDKYKLNNSWP